MAILKAKLEEIKQYSTENTALVAEYKGNVKA